MIMCSFIFDKLYDISVGLEKASVQYCLFILCSKMLLKQSY